jgi:hypothetical protein
MSDYEHGKMEIESQEKTFSGFIRFVTNATIWIILFLIFLALVAI